MSNEVTTETPDAIKILEAKINAFNKQWQGYNQNWTNISKITLESEESTYNQYGVTLIFSKGIIKYDKNTVDDTSEKIIVTRVDNQLYYYLYNLPNNCGICIKEENSICYITEDETQTFSLNNFVYHNDNNFIEKQEISDDYHTIDWNTEEGRWSAGNINKQYGITLNISGETIEYIDEKIIFKQIDGKSYYYLYNLPNHFGIRINEQDAVCYSKEGEKQDKRFSVGDLIYRDGSNFIITKDPTTSGYYFTIDPVNKHWVATYKTAFFKEVGSTFDFNFMQRLDSPYTYFRSIANNSYRDYVIEDVNNNIFSYCRENYGMEAPFHLYMMKNINNTYEEIYDDQTWYFRSEVINGTLKNNLVILHEKPVSAESFYQLVR